MNNPQPIVDFQTRLRERRDEMMRIEFEMLHVSDYVFELLASQNLSSHSPQDVTGHCPIHGVVLPKRCKQGYIRNQCPCERDKRYQARDIAGAAENNAKEAQRKALLAAKEASSDACYTWLGEEYCEYGLNELTFENFNAYSKDLKMVLMRMQAYADNPPVFLLIHGPYGGGKTHLACALLNYRRAHGKPGNFTTGANLFNALLACGDDMKAKQAILTKMYTTDTVVIDDPDHAGPTQYRQDTYKEIFTKRSSRGLLTVITTNIHVKQDAMEMQTVFGGAAASRLNKGLVLVEINADDYRKRQIGG